jgi:hypothetical protein
MRFSGKSVEKYGDIHNNRPKFEHLIIRFPINQHNAY